jgi:hypothetical protein
MEIVDVLGTIVRPVVVVVSHAVAPAPDIVQNPVPILSVLVLVLLELKNAVVTLKFAAVNVPSVRVSVEVEPSVIAPARVTVIPAPLIVTLLSDLPLLVIVPLAKNVGLILKVPPVAERVRLPAMFTSPETDGLFTKVTSLNQLPLEIVSVANPPLTIRLGAFETVPPVVPNDIVAVVVN